jgi:O-antigen/teichoic acid export membrane protein
MSFSKTVFRNFFYGFTAQIAVKVLSFIFSVMVVRSLGAETYGQYIAVLAFGTVFAIFSDLGLGAYSTREVARMRKQEGGTPKIGVLFSNILVLRLVLTVFTGIAIIAAAFLTKRPLEMIGAIALNTLGLFFFTIQGSSEAVIAGYERLGYVSITRIIYQLVFVILGSVVLWVGIGYYGLIIANLIGLILFAYMNWRLVTGLGFKLKKPSLLLWPSFLRASIPFGLIGFALGLSYKFDTVLLNITRSDLETGYYNAAYNLVFSVVMISNVINTALYPSLVARTAESPQNLTSIYQRVWRYLLIISLPIAVGGWILSPEIINFLYGAEYAASAYALSIVIWVIPLMFSSEFLGYVVVIRNQEKRVARAVIISTVVNVLLNLILVPRYGFIAAAYMTVATEAVLVLQHLYSLKDMVRQTNFIWVFVRPFISVLLMGIVVYVIKDYFQLFFTIALGIVTYGLSALLFKVIGMEELKLIRNLQISQLLIRRNE